MSRTQYRLTTASWTDKANRALKANDKVAAFELLNQLLNPRMTVTVENGQPHISTLGLALGICKDCECYTKDPDPLDPGWPMMCGELGIDMLEPYATCIKHTPKES